MSTLWVTSKNEGCLKYITWETGVTLPISTKCPKRFWGEAAFIGVYTINRHPKLLYSNTSLLMKYYMEFPMLMNFSKYGGVHASFSYNPMNTVNLSLVAVCVAFLVIVLNTKAIVARILSRSVYVSFVMLPSRNMFPSSLCQTRIPDKFKKGYSRFMRQAQLVFLTAVTSFLGGYCLHPSPLGFGSKENLFEA
ncbi:hypothetical protein OSB04_024989 [Centaurea solstitialis]|uniref:Uncharacterized protein n=1 Tax=Centaurea solstitialis TaxID=347529 RepID=A0AA38W3L6_9ASTR|nr:hypothetical protein OSB04_024989 [Centaurea solstitialis]